MMELATSSIGTGNIGIGNTSTLATLNSDRFLVIDGQEPFLVGASLKDLAARQELVRFRLHSV